MHKRLDTVAHKNAPGILGNGCVDPMPDQHFVNYNLPHQRGLARLNQTKQSRSYSSVHSTNKPVAPQTSSALQPRATEETQIRDVRSNHCASEYVHCYSKIESKKRILNNTIYNKKKN